MKRAMSSESTYKQKAFLIQHRDETICKQRTSGGAFTAIAKQIISNGGVVFGVTMDDRFDVKHIMVDSIEGLEQFRNSKYVQSNVGESYRAVKKELEKDRLVCFSGTPCQIRGLKAFLSEDYENLLLVDVVCRAVPSPGIWHKYVDEILSTKGELEKVRFRDKDLGYQYSTMKVVYSDHISRDGIETDPWLRMFFSGTIIRPSCTECKFRARERQSDITMWDCLNLHDFNTTLDQKKGTTRVLVHSSKGEKYINKVLNDVECVEISPESAVKNVQEFVVSPKRSAYSKSFFDEAEKDGLEVALNKYFKNDWKRYLKKSFRMFLNKYDLDLYVKRLIRHR